MSLDMLQSFLGWCTLINMGLLLWWFLFFLFAHDWIYFFHGKFFKLSVETFDSIHYSAMAFFKLSFFLLNLVPYIVLLIIR